MKPNWNTKHKNKKKKMMADLFEFNLKENKDPIDNTNINRLSVFVSDEQKAFIKKNEKEIFAKYNVDNFSDYVIKKFYEDVKS